jgi:hypothetical protein
MIDTDDIHDLDVNVWLFEVCRLDDGSWAVRGERSGRVYFKAADRDDASRKCRWLSQFGSTTL